MAYQASVPRMGELGALSTMTKVFSSGQLISATEVLSSWAMTPLLSMIIWKVNSTSAEVKGSPSCHFTPLRRLKV